MNNKRNGNPIKRIFDLYTSDLSISEIEMMIKKDSSDVYRYFASDVKMPQNKNKVIRALIFVRNLFNAFIMKLTPARRIIYFIALLFFISGYFLNGSTFYVLLSFVLLNILLAFELADKLLVKDDIDLAKKIQSKLMPGDDVKINNYEVASFYEAAKEIGGDYYDFIENGENKLFVIGDISGKGLAAALYMVRVQTMLHTLINKFHSSTPLLSEINAVFSQNLNPGYFLTMAGAYIRPGGGLQLFNAGHPPLLYYSAKNNSFTEINPKGIGIGLNKNGLFEKSLEETLLQPENGDILVFYTDGLSELMNDRNMAFGIENVKSIIKRHSGESLEEIKEKIKQAADTFRGYSAKNDDITFVMLRAKDHNS